MLGYYAGAVARTSLFLLISFCAAMPDKGVCAGAGEALERPETTISIDRKDPGTHGFPGGRGENQLILYTPAFGKNTGTNMYGSEAVVRSGMVVSCGGNNSRIFDDGYVLSGHGAKAEWVRKNLTPGAEVRIDDGIVRAKFTLKSKYYETHARLENAMSRIAVTKNDRTTSREACLKAIEEAHKALDGAMKAIVRNDRSAAEPLLREADKQSRAALYAAEPSRTTERRGAWFRLIAKSKDDVRTIAERAADTHLNMLFPETVYWSTTLCPKLFPEAPDQAREFKGWDPLKTLIDEAHARGIQIHAWCEIFFIGPGNPPLAVKYPQWVARDRAGNTTSSKEEGFCYFCPANPEPREYIMRNLLALAGKYDLDGVQLDYIRYPHSMPFEAGLCYCDYCRQAFKKEAGADPRELSPEKAPKLWARWNAWREERVSSFVREASRRLHGARPGIIVSAAVFPEAGAEARQERFQNWPDWAANRWVDLLCPMIYGNDSGEVARLTKEVCKLAGGVPVQAGLGPYLGFSGDELVRQIALTRDAGACGQALFSEETLTPEQREALKNGPYRLPAKIGK